MDYIEEVAKIAKEWDAFHVAALSRMDDKVKEGFSGWDDPLDCPEDALQALMVDKADRYFLTEKDLLDVANYAMMLWSRLRKGADDVR